MKTCNNCAFVDFSNLKNDNINETFTLKYSVGDVLIPIRYIKIVPILSWSPSFNFTIWYIEFSGDDDQVLVEDSIKRFNSVSVFKFVKISISAT